MTVQEAIEKAKALTGNAVEDAALLRWLSELDGRLMLDFYRGDAWAAYDLTDDGGTELLVPFPWDALYVHYLEAMVYYSAGEYERYRNSYEMFNSMELDYRKWYARNLLPIDLRTLRSRPLSIVTAGRAAKPFWYLSAYAVAVKHGYAGTEAEWLESLKGMDAYESAVEGGYTGTEAEFYALLAQAAAGAARAEAAAQTAEGARSASLGSAQAAAASAQAAGAAKDAIENMTVSASALPPGSAPTAVKRASGNTFHIAFGLVEGAKGATGDTGPQGAVGPQGPQGVQGVQGPRGISGVSVAADGVYAFRVDENGHLILSYTEGPSGAAPGYAIDENGHLILTIS